MIVSEQPVLSGSVKGGLMGQGLVSKQVFILVLFIVTCWSNTVSVRLMKWTIHFTRVEDVKSTSVMVLNKWHVAFYIHQPDCV